MQGCAVRWVQFVRVSEGRREKGVSSRPSNSETRDAMKTLIKKNKNAPFPRLGLSDGLMRDEYRQVAIGGEHDKSRDFRPARRTFGAQHSAKRQLTAAAATHQTLRRCLSILSQCCPGGSETEQKRANKGVVCIVQIRG